MLPIIKLNVFIVLTILIKFCFAQQQTQISYISPEQIKDVGDEVQLNCTTQNVGEYSVIWNKRNRDRPQDSSIISANKGLIVSDKRFALNYDEETATYSLKIKDIVNSDAGIYECQIIITAVLKQTKVVELQVRHPPLINENLTTLSVLVNVGEPTELKCIADGYPRPTVTWKREYNAILPIGGSLFTGNVLKLSGIYKEDRGTYICMADNGVGTAVSKTINLEVEFPPTIYVPRPRVAQSVDFEIDLVCRVEAFPAPSVSWFKNDKEIHNGDEYRISNFASEDEFTTSSVRIKSVQKHSYGDYMCKAHNKKGYAEAKLNLYESIIPVPRLE